MAIAVCIPKRDNRDAQREPPPPRGPKNMKITAFGGFVVFWGSLTAPRGMPEAVAVDPESISPNGGMATPFSLDLMSSGPRFGLAKALAEKSNLA